MVDRTTFSHLTPPPLPGGGSSGFLQQYAERLGTLFDASALPLTTVGGTANAVTAALDPPLATPGVFVDGMKFTLTWAATNTGGVTLAINGGTALPVLDASGAALAANDLGAGLRSLIEFIGGAFRILSSMGAGDSGGQGRFYQQFTASGTWTKPAGLDPDTMVTIEAWGGGGGGATNSNAGGGGGGGYVMRRVRVGDLPATVSVTIGAGGAAGVSGGNTTFGSLLTAYAGSRAAAVSSGGGGGGGGELAAGGVAPAPTGGAGGAISGGPGGAGNNSSGGTAVGGSDATHWGGGGGGGGAGGGGSTTGGSGGRAIFGGGGGGGDGATGGSGGISLFGGDGGADGVAGTAPGGGGGRNAAGARGEVRVWI